MTPSVRVLASGLGFLEAPVVLEDDRVAFCDGTRGLVLALADGAVTEIADVGGHPNGLALGSDGALYLAQFGTWPQDPVPVAPSLVRIERDGRPTTNSTDGRIAAPNDLAFGPDGRLWITDSGDPDHLEPKRRSGIFALSRAGLELVVELEPVFANGIGFDPEGRLLWTETATRRLCRLENDGTHVVAELPESHLPDGFAVAADGRVFVATLTSRGITVLSASGELLDHLEVGMEPTNCAFRGSSLVVTASTDSSGLPGTGSLFELETDATPLPLRGGSQTLRIVSA
ncbi:MAG: SMP-30/gluconolactonase/LRE family protein [Gaiellaceae bacterium]